MSTVNTRLFAILGAVAAATIVGPPKGVDRLPMTQMQAVTADERTRADLGSPSMDAEGNDRRTADAAPPAPAQD